MLSIDEAIKHCEEVANSAMANYRLDEELYGIEDDECLRYADEYRQLAEWLRELNAYREGVEKIKGQIIAFDGFGEIDSANVLKYALALLEVEQNERND